MSRVNCIDLIWNVRELLADRCDYRAAPLRPVLRQKEKSSSIHLHLHAQKYQTIIVQQYCYQWTKDIYDENQSSW